MKFSNEPSWTMVGDRGPVPVRDTSGGGANT
jgi:hypothetical protein